MAENVGVRVDEHGGVFFCIDIYTCSLKKTFEV